MGSTEFLSIGEGRTAREAFRNAVDDALHRYGYGGYTGSIAEKSRYMIVTKNVPEDEDLKFNLAEDYDVWPKSIQDKWGPAGAIQLDESKWIFFGIASC
jgi:hypothetical protein